ncbi:16S rRNA (guanine(966)-N(2))-methyltransferase RsmD [Spirochaeta cellobiosiphila]|uniref:16S rRNA (guanine(966)-N(2))-methyltransferase RsmD n=1 Tax=Spirochaeta cellobiosiphila TaxID=504483 RepID=UPI000409982B|nr:16S rRNA (guanine(966)-N(2))-methyltransferase RsmD [Spirochaeta cellobiosiphila]
MRITGGLYKGRIIKMPKGEIRPAMDRMRESMFSILGSLEGKRFLDVFSGSGCVGIEAASRGAVNVDLVEKDRIKRSVILENISIVECPIKLIMMPAERFLKFAKGQWDVIHLDPPFPYKYKLDLLKTIASKDLVTPGGYLMMHYPGEESYPETIGLYNRVDFREYGRSHLIFYQRSVSE